MPTRSVHGLRILGLLAVVALGCQEERRPRSGPSEDLAEVLAGVRVFEPRLPWLGAWGECEALEGRCLDVLAPNAPWIDGLRRVRPRLTSPLGRARLGLVLSRSLEDLEEVFAQLDRADREGHPVELERAVAHWRRAELGEPARRLEALGWIERALERDPSELTALYDHALFLDRLGLPEAARAWSRYLRSETAEAGREEARGRLAEAIDERRARRSLPGTEERSWFSVAGASEVLVWADAVLDGSAAARLAAEAELGRLAAEASGAGADTTPRDLLAYLPGLAEGEALELAEAVRIAGNAMALYGQREYAAAVPGLEESLARLEGSGFPLAGWVGHYLEVCRYREGDRRLEPFLRLRDSIAPGHRSLLAYVDWMLGLLRLSEGRYEEGFELYRSALDTLTELGAEWEAAHLRALLADAATELGEPEEGWKVLDPLLPRVPGLDPRIAKLVYQEAGETARALGHDGAALRFFSAAVTAAAAARDPLLEVEALVQRAEAHRALAATAAAREDLDRAEELFGTISDDGARRTAEVSLLEARSRIAESSSEERLAALAALSGTTSEVLLPRLLHLEALEELARGDAEAAGGKLLEAAALLDRQARGCDDWHKRLSLARRSRELFEELVRIRLDRGSPEPEVADAVERTLHAAYLAPFGVPAPGPGGEERWRVPPGELELSVLSLEERTVLVARVGGRERVEALDVSREELLALGRTAGFSPWPDAEERAARARLAGLLSVPAAGELPAARVLRLVLDPEITGLPVDLLPWSRGAEAGGGRPGDGPSGLGWAPFLVHSPPGAGEPQSVDRSGPRPAGAPPERAVVVGNPVGAVDLFGRRLPDLEDSGEEAREVGALYPELLSLSGEEATREGLLAALGSGGTRVCHYGGHAVTGRDARSVGYLALAGGSHLYGDEIARLELPDLELVVLAGCEAAGTGEAGVAGLAVPFLLAGADAVVASTLPLRDGPAREVFVELHRRVREGGSVAEAVAEARRRFLGGEDRAAAQAAAGLRVFERR